MRHVKKKMFALLLVMVMLLSSITVNAAEVTTEATTEASTEVATEVTTGASTEMTTEVTTESTTTETTEVSQGTIDAILNDVIEDGITSDVDADMEQLYDAVKMDFVNSSKVRGGNNIYLMVNKKQTTHKQMSVGKVGGSDDDVIPTFCCEKGVSLNSGTYYQPTAFNGTWIMLGNNPWLRYRIAFALKYGESRQAFYGYTTNNYLTVPQESYCRYLATQLLIWDYIYHGSESNYNNGIAGGDAIYGVDASDSIISTVDAWNGFGGSLSYWYDTYSHRVQNVRRLPSFLNGSWGSDAGTPTANFNAGSYTLAYDDATSTYRYTLTDTSGANWQDCGNQEYYSTHPTALSCCKVIVDVNNDSDPTNDITVERSADGKNITFISDHEITTENKVKVQFVKNDLNTVPGDVAVYTASNGGDNQAMVMPEGECAAPGGYIMLSSEINTFQEVTIGKVDADTNQPIQGVGFQIFKDEACTQLITSGVTASNGKLRLQLPQGEYWIKETSCPDNYILDSTPKKVTLTAENTATITIKNKRKALIVIDKKDKVNLAAMQGVIFGIYLDEDCTQLERKVTTNQYGLYAFYIPEGTYYVKELECDEQHMIDDTVHKIVATNTETNRVEVKDQPLGKIQISKVGDKVIGAEKMTTVYGDYSRLTFSKANLEGVEFTIYDKDGSKVGVITTDEDGKAISDYLPVGTYTLEETKTPEGLAKLDETFDVEIVDRSSLVEDTLGEEFTSIHYAGEATVNNNVVSATINVYKEGEILNIEDGTYSFGKKPLEGVVYGVYANAPIKNSNDEEIVSKDTCIGYLVTNEDGKASMKASLVGGSYYYKELKTLPGYIIDEDLKPFTVKLGNDAETVIEVNKENPDVNNLYKTEIKLAKVDKTDHKVTLEGVQFELYNSKNQLMGSYTTDKDGLITVDALPLGEYYFKEIKAKDGYVLDDSAIDIVVPGTINNSMSIDFENVKKPDTPKTGDTFNPIIFGTGIVAFILSVGMIVVMMFKKRKFIKADTEE